VSDPVAEPQPIPVPEPAGIPFADRFGAFCEIVLCSGFPTQILLIIVLAMFGVQPRLANGTLSPAFVFTLSLVDAALVIGLIVYLVRHHGERVKDVLLGGRVVWRELLFGVALLPAVFTVVALVLLLIFAAAPYLHDVPRNPLEDMLQTPGNSAMFAVVVTVAGGVREEIQRGFIVHRFGQYLGGEAVGVAVYSVAFGLGHLEQGRDVALATGALGLFWGVVYVMRRSVLAPMVSHAGFNLGQLLKYSMLR
jgi:membrane protease YdiL (CAAX protease family)